MGRHLLEDFNDVSLRAREPPQIPRGGDTPAFNHALRTPLRK